MKTFESPLTRREAIGRAASLGAVLAAFPRTLAAAINESDKKKVLFFSKSAEFEHSVIKTPKDGGPSFAEKILSLLGEKHNLDFTFSKDGSLFSPDYLAQFDAYFFYTTGILTTVGKDGNPAMTAAGKQALLDAVRGGKGFIGTHAASDTFHTVGQGGAYLSRYHNYGEKEDPYLQMLGGEFIIHNKQQEGTIRVVDNSFPGMEHLGSSFRIIEEWYSMKDFRSDLHVLLVQDTAGMEGLAYQRPPYPETWVRRHGQGRVFYTSMGHREDVWTSERYQNILAGGLSWALGRVDADDTPNIAQVTPDANHLPPEPPKP